MWFLSLLVEVFSILLMYVAVFVPDRRIMEQIERIKSHPRVKTIEDEEIDFI